MFVRNLGTAAAERELWLQMKATLDAGFDINQTQVQWEQTRGITPAMFWRVFDKYFYAPNNDPSQTPPNVNNMISRAYDLQNQGKGWAEIVNTIAAEVGRSYDYVQAALNSAGFVFVQRPEVLISTPGTREASIVEQMQTRLANGMIWSDALSWVSSDFNLAPGQVLAILSAAGMSAPPPWTPPPPVYSSAPAAPQMTQPVQAPPPPAVTVSAPAPAPVQSPAQSVNTGGGARPGSGGGWVPSPGAMPPPPAAPAAGVIPGTIPGTISTGGTVPSEGTPHNMPTGDASQPAAPKSAAGLLVLAALALLAGQ